MVLIFNSLSSSKQKSNNICTTYGKHTYKKKTQNHAFVTFLPNLALNRARYNSTAPHPHPSLTWEGNWGTVAETGQKKSPTRHVVLAFMKPSCKCAKPLKLGWVIDTRDSLGVGSDHPVFPELPVAPSLVSPYLPSFLGPSVRKRSLLAYSSGSLLPICSEGRAVTFTSDVT